MKINILNLLHKELDTLKIIKYRNLTYQKQVVNTMYNRAKHHPHQTENMKQAMKVFSNIIKKINNSIYPLAI